MGKYLIAIDPGLAQWGWSIWDISNMPPPALRTMSKEFLGPRLLDFGSHKTPANWSLASRHLIIADKVRWLVSRSDVSVIIERPATAGYAYARNRGNSAGGGAMMGGVSAVTMAAGVIFGAAAGFGANSVEWVEADRMKKEERWHIVAPLVGLERRASGNDGYPKWSRQRPTNKEKRDAIWYGAKALTDQRRTW